MLSKKSEVSEFILQKEIQDENHLILFQQILPYYLALLLKLQKHKQEHEASIWRF